MPDFRRETLLFTRNALLVLDQCLDGVNRISGIDVQGDGLVGVNTLDEDPLATILHNIC